MHMWALSEFHSCHGTTGGAAELVAADWLLVMHDGWV
jgi:hypothetical protein